MPVLLESCQYFENQEKNVSILFGICVVFVNDIFSSVSSTTSAVGVRATSVFSFCSFLNCGSSSCFGGAVSIQPNDDSSTFAIYFRACHFSKCSGHEGGSIHILVNESVIDGCNISNSISESNGGAIFFSGKHMLFNYIQISLCQSLMGGGIYTYNRQSTQLFEIFYGIFRENSAQNGSSILAFDATLDFSIYYFNQARMLHFLR